jgi:HD-GYP domain-containing protein (c-di-GMP phosphodiesterase class II)
MVADTVDAMTTNRPYRKAMPFDRVLSELQKYSGKQFDPEVVDAFRRSAEIKRMFERPSEMERAEVGLGRQRVARLAVH